MEPERTNNFNPLLPTTNYFLYKDKKYPFNFNLFRLFSAEQFEVSPNVCINLIEESKCPFTLSEEYI